MDMDDIHLIRVIRTASSERFIFRQNGEDAASLDLHFIEGGKIDGHLTLLTPDHPPEDKVQELISLITESILAHQPLEDDPMTGDERLHITVTHGALIGNFVPR